MAVDASIPLSINPSATAGPDLGKMLTLADMAQDIQIKRTGLAKQNALAQLMGNPGSYAPDGSFTPQAVQAISAVDPNTGMKVREQTIEDKVRQAQEEHYKTEAGKSRFDYLSGVAGLATDAYDAAKKAGQSEQDARAAAMAARNDALKNNGGVISDQDAATAAASPFDPMQAKAFALSNTDYAKRQSDTRKEDTADKRESELERHNRESEERMAKALAAKTTAADEKPGQQETIKIRDKDGNVTEIQAFVKGPGKVVDIAGNTIDPAMIVGAAKTGTSKGGSGAEFTPEMGSLMGALAEQGVSLPSGFRGKEQQVELYKGILDRNKGKTPDEIAKMIKTGQIEFGAQKKETQTAAGAAGKVEVAENELEEFIPLVREASAKVSRGDFVPLSKLIQMGDSSISDPALKDLKIKITSVLNAYDQLAARGGTDVEKRRENRSLLLAAESPEALETGLKAFQQEAAAAHRAAVKATKVPELPNEGKDSKPAPKTVDDIQAVSSKEQYDALPKGAHYSKPGDAPGTYRTKQ